jgi:hypothetical protein
MPIEAKQPERRGVGAAGRLFLNHLVQQVPERVVARGDEVGRHARRVGELHRRRIGGLRELIDLEVLLHRLDARLGRSIDQKGAEEEPVAVGARAHDDVTGRHLTLVAGWQDEVLAAFAAVLAGDAHIGHPAVPEVIDATQHLRRDFEDQRAFLGVEPDEVVDRVVVGGELDGAGIDQVFPDHVGLVVRPELADRVAHAGLVHDRDRHQISLQGARAIEVVVDLLHRVGRRIAVVQVQRADGTFNLVRHGDAGSDRCRHLEGLGKRRSRKGHGQRGDERAGRERGKKPFHGEPLVTGGAATLASPLCLHHAIPAMTMTRPPVENTPFPGPPAAAGCGCLRAK